MQTKGFELAGVTDQNRQLHGCGLLGEVRVHLFHDLVVIVAYAGELPTHIVQNGNVFSGRGIAFIYAQLSSEEPCENEPADVCGAVGLAEHLSEACLLLVVELEIIAMRFGIQGLRTAAFSRGHSIEF